MRWDSMYWLSVWNSRYHDWDPNPCQPSSNEIWLNSLEWNTLMCHKLWLMNGFLDFSFIETAASFNALKNFRQCSASTCYIEDMCNYLRYPSICSKAASKQHIFQFHVKQNTCKCEYNPILVFKVCSPSSVASLHCNIIKRILPVSNRFFFL